MKLIEQLAIQAMYDAQAKPEKLGQTEGEATTSPAPKRRGRKPKAQM